MEKRLQVVVYGSSLTMAGIAASLRADPTLDVVWITAQACTALQQDVPALAPSNAWGAPRPRDSGPAHSSALPQALIALDPAVIAFDLSDPSSGLDVRLLRERPGLLLVGVDPSSDELLVLSSQQERAVAVADLLSVIHRGREGETPTRCSGQARRGGDASEGENSESEIEERGQRRKPRWQSANPTSS
jgi:hypothetical protein